MAKGRREKGLDEIEFEALKRTKKKIYGARKPSGRELLDLMDSKAYAAEVRRRRRPVGRGA